MSVRKQNAMGEPINLADYEYIFTTYATERFLPSLDIGAFNLFMTTKHGSQDS